MTHLRRAIQATDSQQAALIGLRFGKQVFAVVTGRSRLIAVVAFCELPAPNPPFGGATERRTSDIESTDTKLGH